MDRVLYDNCELDWKLETGTGIHLRQRTRYPWDGEVVAIPCYAWANRGDSKMAVWMRQA